MNIVVEGEDRNGSAALNLENATKICARIARGIEIGLACESEGIDEALFRRCLFEDGSGVLRGIFARERVAFEERLIQLVDQDARGAQFILERKLGWIRNPEKQLLKEAKQAQAQSNRLHIPPDEIAQLLKEAPVFGMLEANHEK